MKIYECTLIVVVEADDKDAAHNAARDVLVERNPRDISFHIEEI